MAISRKPPKLRRDDAAEKLYRGIDLGVLLEEPHDYFGTFICERKAKAWNPTAFFPTPHHLVEAMTHLAFEGRGSDGRDTRTLTANDPAVGSGRMLLHASNYSLRLSGQDIDPVVLCCCLINGVLYAPWMSFPLPESVFAEAAPAAEPGATRTTSTTEAVPPAPLAPVRMTQRPFAFLGDGE